MKTTITKYKRGNKTITLVGAMHIGTSNYYKKIQEEIDSDRHDRVLFEGVSGYKENNVILRAYRALADFLGIEWQGEIKYKDSWINTDLDRETLLIANKKISKLEDEEVFNKIKEGLEEFKDSFIIKSFIRFCIRFNYIGSKFWGKNTALLELRNYKVIVDTVESLKDYDNICLFYGEAHLKGISLFLKKIGFKKCDRIKLNPLTK